MKKFVAIILLLGISPGILAEEVPVVDYSSDAQTVPTTRPSGNYPAPAGSANSPAGERPFVMPTPIKNEQHLPPKSGTPSAAIDGSLRTSQLDKQLNYLIEQNLPQKIEELQQNQQQLRGQLESQIHQIEQLEKQLRDFYQDLNRRVGGASPAPNSATHEAAEIPVSPTDVQQPPATGTVTTPVTPPPNQDAAFLQEQRAYQAAVDLLPAKKHESELKLRDYLKRYPQGTYAANAHYWLGEISFLQKNFDAAEEEFQIVVNKYPKSKRVPDAILKLAVVYQNQGREERSRQEFQRVIKRYPHSSAARLAKQQLAN